MRTLPVQVLLDTDNAETQRLCDQTIELHLGRDLTYHDEAHTTPEDLRPRVDGGIVQWLLRYGRHGEGGATEKGRMGKWELGRRDRVGTSSLSLCPCACLSFTSSSSPILLHNLELDFVCCRPLQPDFLKQIAEAGTRTTSQARS